MAYYRKQERLNKLFDPVVTITQDQIAREYGNLWKKGVGSKISLSEAVRLALQESDNTAIQVVASQIDDEDFSYVYEGLDIPITVEDNQAIISAKQYSSILKALYFSSIISKEHSEEILSMLTHTQFKDKLPAGIPSGVEIAHKIGLIDRQIYQDCGIVYVPRQPYLLCMLSKSDENTAQERMKSISKEVYDYVTNAPSH